MTIKAIETRYAGCRFRSRLEARWAVFFDTLGVRWEYEPEGLLFDDGTRYLPDFRLPDLRIWFEVKGDPWPIDPKWRRLHDELAVPDFTWHNQRATAQRAYSRILEACRMAISETADDEVAERRAETLQREIARRDLPERAFLAGPLPRLDGRIDRLTFGCMIGPGDPHSGWAWSMCIVCGEVDAAHVAGPVPRMCGHEADDPLLDTTELRIAYDRARSARFEHGESG